MTPKNMNFWDKRGGASCRLHWPKRVSKFIFTSAACGSILPRSDAKAAPFRLSLAHSQWREDEVTFHCPESPCVSPGLDPLRRSPCINTYLPVFFSHWSFTIFLSKVTSARDHRRLKISCQTRLNLLRIFLTRIFVRIRVFESSPKIHIPVMASSRKVRLSPFVENPSD